MASAASMKLSTDEFTAEKVALAKQEEKTMFAQGMVQAEKNMSSSSSAKMTFSSKGIWFAFNDLKQLIYIKKAKARLSHSSLNF